MVEGAGRVPLLAFSMPGSTSGWVCPSRRVAVWIYWLQLAWVDSVAEAEGDEDAICRITCSKPLPSGCIAGVSPKPFCPEGSARHRCETPPQELGFLWKELVEVAHVSLLGCALMVECHFHLFLLYAWFLALKMQTCLASFHTVLNEKMYSYSCNKPVL